MGAIGSLIFGSGKLFGAQGGVPETQRKMMPEELQRRHYSLIRRCVRKSTSVICEVAWINSDKTLKGTGLSCRSKSHISVLRERMQLQGHMHRLLLSLDGEVPGLPGHL